MSTPNQVEIPIAGIEDALVQCAVPGFWGQLLIGVRLLQTAALEVELHKETKTSAQSDGARQTEHIVPSNERVQKVRRRMLDLREKLLVFCPVTSIKGNFKDGQMVSLEITECEKVDPGCRRGPFAVAR